MSQIPATYVMGHDDRERRRLSLQASILNPLSDQLLRRAGLSAGLRVLDIGCGVGELSMVAARLVGRRGRVTGIDTDDGALALAAQRAREQGLDHIDFAHRDIGTYRTDMSYDAVIGRHILIHTPDPRVVVGIAHSLLNSGGVAVFQEYDFSVVHHAFPEAPLYERTLEVCRALRRSASFATTRSWASIHWPGASRTRRSRTGAACPVRRWSAASRASGDRCLTRIEGAGPLQYQHEVACLVG